VDRPDFLFVYVGNIEQLEQLLSALDGLASGTQVVALGSHLDADVAIRLMHLGVRDYLTFPLDPAKLADSVQTVRTHLAKNPVAPRAQATYSFLPAKPGVGASTITVAAASVLANDLHVRTLLIGGDLYSGPIEFLLKLEPASSLPDALRHADQLDEDLWRKLISRSGLLDVLPSGDHMPAAVGPGNLSNVMELARRLYDVICVDLPSALDPISLALIEESRRIFLITTNELMPLHFAKQRVQQLSSLGLRDRISLILNRDRHNGKNLLSNSQVEESVGLPISFAFPEAYREVQQAVLEGEPVPHEKEMNEAVHALTHFMLPEQRGGNSAPLPIGSRFLEFFRIPHPVTTDLNWRG
jgi:pilus assembly protein CpaE